MTLKELMSESLGKQITVRSKNGDEVTGFNVLYEDEIDNEDDEIQEPSITVRSKDDGDFAVFYERQIAEIVML